MGICIMNHHNIARSLTLSQKLAATDLSRYTIIYSSSLAAWEGAAVNWASININGPMPRRRSVNPNSSGTCDLITGDTCHIVYYSTTRATYRT